MNAMWGEGDDQAMLLEGNVGKQRMHILVDTWSTHNFMSQKLIAKLKQPVTEIKGTWVEIPNGQ